MNNPKIEVDQAALSELAVSVRMATKALRAAEYGQMARMFAAGQLEADFARLQESLPAVKL